MIRRVLQLLLALTLVLNGVSAPWAMMRMKHEAQTGHGTHGRAVTPGSPGTASPDAHALRGHLGHHPLKTASDADAQVPVPVDDTGCSDTNCHCGCMLPPVAAFPVLTALAHPAAVTPLVSLQQHAVIRRGSPPFRPPAV